MVYLFYQIKCYFSEGYIPKMKTIYYKQLVSDRCRPEMFTSSPCLNWCQLCYWCFVYSLLYLDWLRDMSMLIAQSMIITNWIVNYGHRMVQIEKHHFNVTGFPILMPNWSIPWVTTLRGGSHNLFSCLAFLKYLLWVKVSLERNTAIFNDISNRNLLKSNVSRNSSYPTAHWWRDKCHFEFRSQSTVAISRPTYTCAE